MSAPTNPTTPARRHAARHERTNHARFLTFSCYHRLPLFSNRRIRDLFAEHLRAVRDRFGCHLYAWVVMSEHVHLLLWPRLPEDPVSKVLYTLKRGFASRVLTRWRELGARILSDLEAADNSVRFWQRGGGYDRNVFSREEFDEKLRYIHNNPVTRGLVERAEDWAWSSARWYAGGRDAPVEIDPLPPTTPT